MVVMVVVVVDVLVAWQMVVRLQIDEGGGSMVVVRVVVVAGQMVVRLQIGRINPAEIGQQRDLTSGQNSSEVLTGNCSSLSAGAFHVFGVSCQDKYCLEEKKIA